MTLPNSLEEQVSYLDDHPDVGLVASLCEFIDERGETIAAPQSAQSPEQIYYKLSFSNCFMNCSVSFRREPAIRIGAYDESFRFAMDYDLWLRLSRQTKIVQLDRMLVKWRDVSTNISNRFKVEQACYAKSAFVKNMRGLLDNEANIEELSWFHFHASPFEKESTRVTYHLLQLLDHVNSRLVA